MASKPNMLNYVHFQRDNFLEARQLLGAKVDESKISSKIQSHYRKLAKNANERQLLLEQQSPVAQELLSIFATSDNIAELIMPYVEDGVQDYLVGKNSIDQELRDMSAEVSGFYTKIKNTDNQVQVLSNLLSGIDNTLNDMSKVNGALIEYCASLADTQKDSFNESFNANGNLHILNINPTAISSLSSLKSRIETLRKITNTPSGMKLPEKVSYINSKGEQATTSVSNLVFSMRQLLINILGGYGEALSAVYAMSKADEIIHEAFGNIPNITISGSGTQKLTNGQTSKSDIKIAYNDNSVNINMGISAKAQLLGTGKKTTTTFQTSRLEVFLRGLLKNYEYNFLNNLYHGVTSSNEQVLLNRYIAAMNFDNAVTGWNLGDNVILLSYLNKVISVADFYNSIIKNSNKISDYPNLSIKGLKDNMNIWVGEHSEIATIDDETPLEKSVLAWERSKAIRQILMGLQAQIQYTH